MLFETNSIEVITFIERLLHFGASLCQYFSICSKEKNLLPYISTIILSPKYDHFSVRAASERAPFIALSVGLQARHHGGYSNYVLR